MEFAKNLKELRLVNKFTQIELSKKVGVNQSSYSDWERGVSRPEYETLVLLADIFDVSVDELFGRK